MYLSAKTIFLLATCLLTIIGYSKVTGIYLYNKNGLRFVIPASTPKIKEIFIGRCNDFQIIMDKDIYKQKYAYITTCRNHFKKVLCKTYFGFSPMDCNALWNQFKSAFAFKDRHTLKPKPEDFSPFFQNVIKKFDTTKVLLWTGVHDIVFKLANDSKRYTTIDQFMPGK